MNMYTLFRQHDIRSLVRNSTWPSLISSRYSMQTILVKARAQKSKPMSFLIWSFSEALYHKQSEDIDNRNNVNRQVFQTLGEGVKYRF